MFILTLSTVLEEYEDLDSAMNDCFLVYPDASFSWWNEDGEETFMDVIDGGNVIGRIIER
jgi:hypothetical protein